MRLLLILVIAIMSSCSTTYVNKELVDKQFPSVKGTSLTGKNWNIPQDMKEDWTILLVGYKQNSQFDIDRWLIGLDMKKVTTATYELPTIQGLFPRMFSTKIDAGMRKGIPKELWRGVITIYKDGEIVQKFTGNEQPNNARVLLIDKKGSIRFFHDDGFSVSALNQLTKLTKQ